MGASNVIMSLEPNCHNICIILFFRKFADFWKIIPYCFNMMRLLAAQNLVSFSFKHQRLRDYPPFRPGFLSRSVTTPLRLGFAPNQRDIVLRVLF